MDLSKDYKVRNYSVEEKVLAGKDYIIYNMVRDGFKQVKVCEFFPHEMVSREESGAVEPVAGQEQNFAIAKDQFLETARKVKSFGFPEFVNIVDIFEENKTVYMEFEEPEGVALSEYIMKMGGKLNYKDAYDMVTPLVSPYGLGFDNGIYYRLELENMKVSSGGKLRYTGLFRSEYSVQYAIEDIANIFYTLVTGQRYIQVLARPSALSPDIPPMLDNILYNVLFSNPEYQSISDYYGKLTEAVKFGMGMNPADTGAGYTLDKGIEKPPVAGPGPVSGPLPGAGEYIPPNPPAMGQYTPQSAQVQYNDQSMYNRPYQEPQKNNTGKVVAGCAAVGCLGLVVVGLLLFFFVASAIRSGGSFLEGGINELIEEFAYDYNEYDYPTEYEYDPGEYYINDLFSFVSGENTDIALNDSIIDDDSYVYYGLWDGWAWNLVMESKATGDVTELAQDVMPAYMDIAGSVLVYADVLKDYSIYAVDLDTGALWEVTGDRSAYLKLYDGKVYYANLMDWCSVYSTDMATGVTVKLNDTPSEYLNVVNGNIYYLDWSDNFNIYAMDLNGENITRVSDAFCDNLIIKDSAFYYIEYDSDMYYVEAMDGAGNVTTFYDISAYNFDVLDGTIFYSDMDDGSINAYNIYTEENEYLADVYANYLKICGRKVYFYDYMTGGLYALNLDTMEQTGLYQGEADFDIY